MISQTACCEKKRYIGIHRSMVIIFYNTSPDSSGNGR
jgi:hypothetical protein